MDIVRHIRDQATAAIASVFGFDADPEQLIIQPTRAEFAGHYTLVTFPLSGSLRKSPPDIGEALGQHLVDADAYIESYNVVKGFLNLTLTQQFWASALTEMAGTPQWWKQECQETPEKVMVEFSSPNTNKPLHLGHIRNILLGWSVSQIFREIGHDVVKVQVINDRGIAICKSMVAWQEFAQGATPESTGIKPDHFVGDWYVHFEKALQEEYQGWQQEDAGRGVYRDQRNDDETEGAFFKRYKNTYFNVHSALGRKARAMLQKWEAGDLEVRALWERMNQWVYNGFDKTYERLGVDFDKLYYESETYLLGRELVERGLAKGVFEREEDGSIWADLMDAGLDRKILLRSDGTSVYITQDLGTAQLRYDDFGATRMIYVVADEQNYHFKALFECLRMLDMPYADGLYHLSYGMVDLPTGTMKTREGTVVDADDLMDEVYDEAKKAAAERGEITGLPETQQEEIIRQISLAALKYFIIKVDPKKRMTFDPAESVDMQGQTGPYVQNAYVRIRSVLRKAAKEETVQWRGKYALDETEIALLRELQAFPQTILLAASQYSPAQIANYCYQLAKMFHRYYHEFRILNAETPEARAFRLAFISEIAQVLECSLRLLGIGVPERM